MRLLRLFSQTVALMPDAQFVLRPRVALLRGQSNPSAGFGFIHRDALAASVHNPKIELSQCMALISGLEIPDGGLGIILRRTGSVREIQPKPELRFSVAVVGFALGGFSLRYFRAGEQFSEPRFIHDSDDRAFPDKHKKRIRITHDSCKHHAGNSSPHRLGPANPRQSYPERGRLGASDWVAPESPGHSGNHWLRVAKPE